VNGSKGHGCSESHQRKCWDNQKSHLKSWSQRMLASKGGTRLGIDVYSGEGWRATVGRCATGRPAGDSDIQFSSCCNRCRGLDGICLGTELRAKQDHLECSSSRTIVTDDWLRSGLDRAAACTRDDFCFGIGLSLTTATMLVRGFCGHRCGLGCNLHRASSGHLRTRCQTGSDP
jgi:hypothetical protein